MTDAFDAAAAASASVSGNAPDRRPDETPIEGSAQGPGRNRRPRRLNEEGEELNTTFWQVLVFAWSYWRRSPVLFASTFVFMALATIADSLLPAASGRLIDLLTTDGPGAAERPVVQALMLFVCLSLAFFVLRNTAVRLTLPLATNNMSMLVRESFAKVQTFSADWHANAFAGSTVRKITRGMWAFDTLTDVILIGIFSPILVILALSVQMALRWPLLGLFMILGAVAFAALSVLLGLKYVVPANRRSNEADSALGAALADAVTCNAIVKAFGAEAREQARLGGSAESWRAKTLRAWRRWVNMWLAQSAVLLTMQTGLIGFVVLRWSEGLATAGDVAFAITAFLIVSSYLRTLGDNLQQLQRAVNELDDVVYFADQEADVKDASGAAAFVPGAGAISFEDVAFRYKNQPRSIYEAFNLSIRAGERVALVGPSGSGKSTFVKLLQRLYDVDGGRIVIDGQDIAGVGQDSLRQAISVVPQDPALFHRTLSENIAYARPDATPADIEAAATRARAHDFIAGLPQGYETLVGERGVKLSGGERQRIAIARAFLADAPILILDEATSSLDSETEADIQAAMDDLIAGRTAIIIAHRLSTIRDADRILVFDGGRIVEEGRHEELLRRKNGRYRALHAIQGAA
ncbi:MAG: ABC transporter ATP-binding protein [Pseudomonadota bacterium]